MHVEQVHLRAGRARNTSGRWSMRDRSSVRRPAKLVMSPNWMGGVRQKGSTGRMLATGQIRVSDHMAGRASGRRISPRRPGARSLTDPFFFF